MTVVATTIVANDLDETTTIKCKDYAAALQVVTDLQARGRVVGCIKDKDKIKFVF